MNILYTVFSQGRGGAEKYPLMVSGKLRDEGHSVHLVTAEKFPVAAEARHCPTIDLVTIPSFRKLSPVDAFRLRSIVDERKIDVVHQTAPRDIFLWRAALAGRKRVGHYITYQIGVPKHHNLLLRLFYGRVDGVVAIASHQLPLIARRIPVPSETVHLVHNAVAIENFSGGDGAGFRRARGIGDGEVVIAAVGNTVKAKGFYDFLKAAVAVAGQDERAVFVWAGTDRGKEGPQAEEAARRSGLGRRLIMTGYFEDVPSLLAASNVFTLPSLSEAFGIVYIEAMAAGLPVVAYRSGGVPDIVTDGVDGLLVPPGDVGKLAESYLALLRDGELRRKLGRKAKESVRRFGMDKHVAHLLEMYARRRRDRQ